MEVMTDPAEFVVVTTVAGTVVVARVLVIVEPPEFVVTMIAPAPELVAVALLFPPLRVTRVVLPELSVVVRTAPGPRGEVPEPETVAVVVKADPAESVVVIVTRTGAAVPLPLVEPPARVVATGAPEESVPVLTTTVLVPAVAVAVTVATVVPPDAAASNKIELGWDSRRSRICGLLTCANAVTKASHGSGVVGRASFSNAVTNTVSEILLVAEAVDVSLRRAAESSGLAEHVGDADFLFCSCQPLAFLGQE